VNPAILKEVKQYHCLDAAQALVELETHTSGLTAAEASERLSRHGPNEIESAAHRTALSILLSQFRSAMAALLGAGAVASVALGDWGDAIAILAILLLNGILGFVQEYRAERAVEHLRQLASPAARVRRGGQVAELESRLVVPGDVVLLEAGQVIPADGRLIESANLEAQEAVLTGESHPVAKDAGAILAQETDLAERVNLVFAGTAITRGRGAMAVTATAMKTEMGRIAALLHETHQEETPLQKRLDQLGKRLAAVAVLLVCLLAVIGYVNGEHPRVLLLTAISVAVAAVPEGLPVAVTIALALGARRMYARKALIRKLAAVETLGSVDVICSDKTGTITENRMTVVEAWAAGGTLALDAKPGAELRALLTPAVLCNDAEAAVRGWSGDPTEVALVEAAARCGVDPAAVRAQWPRVAEIPFSSETKWMFTPHSGDARSMGFLKGASSAVLERCRSVPAGALQAHDEMAAKGLRVLAFASLETDAVAAPQQAEFLGFLGLQDPPRVEVREAIALCQSAGIRAVMITGDHPLTASHIAGTIGIPNHRVATGRELAGLTADQFREAALQVSVHARVAPEQKLRLVEVLRQNGHTVAMTGDGVNDAPALKRADIGVAMGLGGTDVARQASGMILLDNSFATIVAAVREGRVIFANLRKFVLFLLACNAGELWVMLLGPVAGMPLPLLPLQILWMNLVTDGLPALALGMEAAEEGVMRQPPRRAGTAIVSGPLAWMVAGTGAALGMLALGAGYWWWDRNIESWQTVVFTALTLSQLTLALGMRTETKPVWASDPRENPYLLGAIGITVAMHMAVIYAPPLQALFRTVPLGLNEWTACLAVSLLSLAAFEGAKALRQKSEQRGGSGNDRRAQENT